MRLTITVHLERRDLEIFYNLFLKTWIHYHNIYNTVHTTWNACKVKGGTSALLHLSGDGRPQARDLQSSRNPSPAPATEAGNESSDTGRREPAAKHARDKSSTPKSDRGEFLRAEKWRDVACVGRNQCRRRNQAVGKKTSSGSRIRGASRGLRLQIQRRKRPRLGAILPRAWRHETKNELRRARRGPPLRI